MMMSMTTDDMNEIRAVAQAERRDRVKNAAKRMIWVTFQREGIHKYPGADTDPALATGDEFDVSFLGFPHRHIFHFEVGIQVFHNDRDIEFIQFKRWLEKSFNDGLMQLDYRSCEMVSDELYDMIAIRYPKRDIKITVSEDGENGSTVYYNTVRPLYTNPI
jgi:hypothetical protein